MHTITHLLNGHLLILYYVIGTILGTLGTAGNEIETYHCPGAYVSTGESDTIQYVIM